MNKNELLEKVSLTSGLTKKESEAAINAFLETLTDVLKAGDKISLKGFGTFEVRTREARMGRNPRTGETMEIAASKVPAFKASSALKNVVNEK
ncbi:integration host factor subunit alpha [Massilimicrobiota sp. An142]|nr:integration host factor subunit alpha [Massilimicrobiota sp. An142]